MPLNLSRLYPQLEEMASELTETRVDFGQRLDNAVSIASQSAGDSSWEGLQERLALHRKDYTWPAPDLTEPFTARHAPAKALPDFIVLSVDGSQIEMERDAAASCFLVNTGHVTLRYGPHPDARLENVPSLYYGDEKIVLRDPADGTREQTVDRAVIAAIRDTAEVDALADLAEALPPDIPALGLLDGALTQWRLSGPTSQVEQSLLDDYLRALDRLREVAAQRPFVVASYISLPATREAIGALRVAVCPFPTPTCKQNCGHLQPLERPCDEVARVRDRDLFGKLLEVGERSALFESRSAIMDSYGRHAVSFFYLNAGDEVARIEVPSWSRSNLDLLHTLLWDQITLGQGYPVALREAHEQAVVRATDRDIFWQMVNSAASGSRIAPPTSQKNVAKRQRTL